MSKIGSVANLSFLSKTSPADLQKISTQSKIPIARLRELGRGATPTKTEQSVLVELSPYDRK